MKEILHKSVYIFLSKIKYNKQTITCLSHRLILRVLIRGYTIQNKSVDNIKFLYKGSVKRSQKYSGLRKYLDPYIKCSAVLLAL